MTAPIAKRLFDVDDYHRMAEVGILVKEDRVELIDGEIVAMTPIGPLHNAAVDRTNRALVTAAGDRAIVRVQGSVRLNRYREPQPDFVLLRPQADFYASRLPGPADILLVIEVAESSLDYDREVKGGIYADSNVTEYWLVDLAARSVSCYSDPHDGAYLKHRDVYAGDTIAPLALPECSIVSDVLMGD